jgi:hypothetical protein
MPTFCESQILASVLDNSRSLTLFYLHHAEGLDKSKTFTLGDFRSNSIHWIVAHLAWAENHLILHGVGNQELNVTWFDLFKLGAPPPDLSQFPSYEETFQTLNLVHQKALELLKTTPDETLNSANHVGIKFGAGDSKRIIIQHAIRHEGAHAGHLGWLLRMHGLKII